MAYNETLANRIAEILLDRKVVFEEKKMFGGIAFMINEKMCCGIVKEELMLRVVDAKYENLLSENYVRPMDFTGKTMRGFVYVAPEGLISLKSLNKYIDIALEFAASDEGKKKKSKK